jgi:aldehyde:ferredoxin oxidoreductase
MPKTGTTYYKADGVTVDSVFPQTLGYLMGLGPPRLAELWPELKAAMDVTSSMNMFKRAHTKHHGVETQGWLGALVNALTTVRDANTHTHQNYNTNGLPNSASNPLQQQIAQEIATSKDSLIGSQVPDNHPAEWGWDVSGVQTPVNLARASLAIQSIIMYEVQNSLTECNYTLPVWASPLKSRKGTIGTDGYRGDPSLSAQVLSAVTGQTFTLKDLETIGLRNFTLMRALFARHMEYWHQQDPSNAVYGSGKDMRHNFDQIATWNFGTSKPGSSSGVLDPTQLETARSLCYQLLGYDDATGLPTQATLTNLGLAFCIPALQDAGLIPE